MEEWAPQHGPGFLTVEIDRQKMTADITRIKFDDNFAPHISMAWKPGLGGYGAIFDGWVEKEKEYGKRWPMLKPGDARIAEINSVTVSPKMTFDTIRQVMKVAVRPLRLMLWTNIRPHLPELDHIAGQTGYAFDHTFRGLLDDMNAVQVKEAELRKWFQSREKHHQERRAIEEKARQMFEANAEQTPKHARSPPVSVSSQASSAQPSPTNRSGGGGAKTPTSSRLVAVDHADEEELDKEAIQKQKEEARQQRRLDAKRQTPLEIDAENIERLQGEIQGLIMQFSSGVFALMKDPQDPNPDFVDATGGTLLHHAVANSNLTLVKFLVSMKANPEKQNCSGVDALNVAIMRGHDDVFGLLVDTMGLTLDQKDALGRTGLHTAARFGRLNYVQRLLAKQDAPMYRLHQPDQWGWTMLHHAANTGQAAVTEWLLQNNARPHQLSLSRKKAADVARHQGCLRLLRTAMMVDRGLVFDGTFHEKKLNIPHGQLWVASWGKTDYQWLMHNKINNIVVVHDPKNPEDALPQHIDDLQNSAKHQVLVCHARDEDSPAAWKTLVTHFAAATRLIAASQEEQSNTLVCCRHGTSCAPAIICGYLQIQHKYDHDEAISHVRELYSTTCLHRAFVEGLKEWEVRVKNRSLALLRSRYRQQIIAGEHGPARHNDPL
eukprot:INCI16389.16.p1 GENE.INCI16389.16~~INCI16389.16.p1  ORF type:complete len:662 (-),score=99.72 INCI16389.16:1011-2996(-)